MSKEFDQIIKEIYKQNKDIDNTISKELIKDIYEVKKSLKGIEQKISSMESILEQLFELVNNITVFIDEAEELSDREYKDEDEDEEDWTPYDDRNFTYDDNDEEDIGGDDYWSSKQDDS